jgi:uncharacterized protein
MIATFCRSVVIGPLTSTLVLCGVMASVSMADQKNEPVHDQNSPKPSGGLVGLDGDPLEMLGVRDIASATDAVAVPMRDGVRLSALIVRPKITPDGWKAPTILIKTPYVPAMEFSGALARAVLPRLIREGYAVAVVNDRGTQWSEGEFHMQHNAKQDGYDTVSWLADQPWSNGKVGSFGCSSSAENQWALATMNHPAHKAMVVMSAAAGVGTVPGYRGQGLFYIGGVTPLAWTGWYREYGNQYHPHLPTGITPEERARLAAAYGSRARLSSSGKLTDPADHLPIADILTAVNAPSSEYNHLITLTPTDGDWNYYDFLREGESTHVPGLHIDSWYTFQAYGTAKAFEYLSGNSPNQHLVMGPTSHCRMGTESSNTMVGDRDVGDARFDYASLIVNWFDHWLRGEDNATKDLPKVQYYPLSSDKWRTATAWPVPGAKELKFYLGSEVSANSLFGDGRLDTEQSHAGKPYDQFLADPLHPVPSRGGGCCDPNVAQDQSSLEARNDVLVYTTDPLTKDLDIAGYLGAMLYLASSARDTDIMIKLVDVYPDGRAFNVLDSARRVRYRDGYDAPKRMNPGQIYSVPVDEMVVAARFLVGHRIRIELSGSNFPNFERNLNTGGPNFNETHPVVAINKIYHDSSHRSYITLPVVDYEK